MQITGKGRIHTGCMRESTSETLRRKMPPPSPHKHQEGDSFLISWILTLDDDNVHFVLTYLLGHLIGADPVQQHVHGPCTARSC